MDIEKIITEIKESTNLETYLQNTIEDVKLLERAKIQEQFFELSIDMLCISDLNGYFKKVSKSFERVLGYTEEEMLSRPFMEFVVEDDLLNTEATYDNLKEGNAIYQFDNRYRCKDGSIKWLSWRCVPMSEGLVYGIARDVTEDKKAEFKLKNYNAQLEEFIRLKDESLSYARSLQNALIPGETLLNKLFPNSFIYFVPKEIVSGDFCWTLEANGYTFVAAADCTGHGVPAAIMSVICSNILNTTVKELQISDPGKILDETTKILIQIFKDAKVDVKDGMDISLCCIDKITNEVRWCGANNPLLYFHEHSLIEISGDKQPVGKHENVMPFTTHTLTLNKGDILYLFSDGYADQFGGDKGKKMMYKHFRKKIEELAPLSMNGQKIRLDKLFNEWKGDLEQLDDVLVLGIKL